MRSPTGLFSIRFFGLRRDDHSNLHRKICFSVRGSIPWGVWFIIQLVLMYRWRWFHAASETNKAVARFGRTVERIEGLSIKSQTQIVLGLSRKYCIPPLHIYRYKVYRAPAKALNFVYPPEANSLHDFYNVCSDGSGQKVLQDKLEFSRQGKRSRLPIVPITQVYFKHQKPQLPSISNGGAFVKSRNGWRGIGAFSIMHQNGEAHGVMLNNKTPIASEDEILDALQAILERDDAIIQPLLRSHSMFAKIPNAEQPSTLRVITIKRGDTFHIYSAFIRSPLILKLNQTDNVNMDLVAPIETETGRILKNENSAFQLHSQLSELEDQVYKALGETPTVPFWSEIAAQSFSAHKRFSDLWAIGWDWFITETEPFLLEGNVYWDVEQPQDVSGGLIEYLYSDAVS